MALRYFCNTKISTYHHHHAKEALVELRSSIENVKSLVSNTLKLPSLSSSSSSPLQSLQRGNWVKLICGASFEDVVDIRNLSLVYTLSGVDCIDCAADASVVSAVNEGIEAATEIAGLQKRPWVMISVNDDKDLHFRKAEFDPEDCPADCSRPCEIVCPANAISFLGKSASGTSSNTELPRVLVDGVITERCYGCGRCLPVCPYDKIREVTYVRDAATTADLLRRNDVDAMEIHTSGRQSAQFKELWCALGDSVENLKLIAVSLPNGGDSTIPSMNEMFSIMKPNLQCFNLWQLDGRPMSGDIGRGATKETIAFAIELAKAKNRPPGFLQLAGGTNAHTIDGLRKKGLFQTTSIAVDSSNSPNALVGGIAYGGYARKENLHTRDTPLSPKPIPSFVKAKKAKSLFSLKFEEKMPKPNPGFFCLVPPLLSVVVGASVASSFLLSQTQTLF